MLIFEGLRHVHYGQAYVFSGERGDTGDHDGCFRGQANGLVGAGQPGMLFLHTGLHTGSVELRVEIASDEPPADESWEEWVEVSFAAAQAGVRLVDWGGVVVCELPLTSPCYRVRYQATGMDAGNEVDTILEGEQPVDSYRLAFWPAPPAADAVVHETSEVARYWHSWAREL